MDLLQLLTGFLGNSATKGVSHALPPTPHQQGLYMQPPWEGNYQIQGSQQPISQPQRPRINAQPAQRMQSNPLQQLFTNNPAIHGAVNPTWQVQKGYAPYSPGEGPRTRY